MTDSPYINRFSRRISGCHQLVGKVGAKPWSLPPKRSNTRSTESPSSETPMLVKCRESERLGSQEKVKKLLARIFVERQPYPIVGCPRKLVNDEDG